MARNSMLITEDQIRDHLAKNLDSIEAGLTLIDKELYIPSAIGTRSFIDLVAKDGRGNLVLIELKRSAAASREAIHEILKYVEAAKEHLAIREDEIRVIIASTEWSELLVSFSKLLTQTTITIKGVHLRVASTEIKAESVEPLEVTNGRIIAPWHDLNYCATRVQVAQVLAEYQARNSAKNMNHHLLVVLHSAAGRISQHEATLRQMATGIAPSEQIVDDPAKAAPRDLLRYHYIVYFAAQLRRVEQYWSILESDSARINEYREHAEEKEGDELLLYLHETAWSMGAPVNRAYLEIGNAAKLSTRILGDEDWRIWGVLRFGSFERNELLSDDTIIGELCGSEGHGGQRFAREFDISNRAQVASVKEGVVRCLEHNSAWRKAVLLALQEVQDDYPQAHARLSIFSPSTGLLMPYFVATKPEGFGYMPNYTLAVLQGDRPIRIYAGFVAGEREPASLEKVLRQYYEGNLWRLMLSFSWGGYTPRDEELTSECGCSYRSVRRDFKQDPLQLYCLDHDHWVPCDNVDIFQDYLRHLGEYPDFFKRLIKLVGERDHGTWWEA
jgi:hypothetical protein